MKRGLIFLLLFLLIITYAAAQENDTEEDAAQTTEENTELPEPSAEAQQDQENLTPDLIPDPVETNTVAANAIAAIGERTTAVVTERTRSLSIIARLGIALAIIAVLVLLIWLVWEKLFKYLAVTVEKNGAEKIKPLTFKKLRLLSAKQIIDVILVMLKILKYIVTALLLIITIPIVFSLFPATQHLAATIFGYIFNPIKNIVISTVEYIPSLFKIVVIVIVTHYVIKLLKFFAVQITKGRLVLPGFYADWAEPTLKILQVLLWAFTVAICYPYLPGSDSRAFQGVSVFVGIIFSLGSSTVIGNLVAGLVITYMRPFRIGDRVQIKETTGFVVEKTLMVVRIRTHKNEYVTFPNLMILGSNITNYNTSSDENSEGLILYSDVTFGYDTPWQTVHEILINAALETDHVQKTPKPYVLQTALDDFYARYQINCYTKEIDKVPRIYTLLHENIQNGFRKAGLDMTAPHYEISTQKKG